MIFYVVGSHSLQNLDIYHYAPRQRIHFDNFRSRRWRFVRLNFEGKENICFSTSNLLYSISNENKISTNRIYSNLFFLKCTLTHSWCIKLSSWHCVGGGGINNSIFVFDWFGFKIYENNQRCIKFYGGSCLYHIDMCVCVNVHVYIDQIVMEIRFAISVCAKQICPEMDSCAISLSWVMIFN